MLPPGSHHALPLGAFDTEFESFYQEFARVAPRSMRVAFAAALFTGTWIAPLLSRQVPPLAS